MEKNTKNVRPIQIQIELTQIMKQTIEIVNNFPKSYKFCFGTVLTTEITDIVVLAVKTNKSKTKISDISELKTKVSVFLDLIKIAKDLNLITVKQVLSMVLLIDSIQKQLVGWEKWAITKYAAE